MIDTRNNSDKTRAIVNTIIAEANLTENEFARRLRGTLGVSTVNRLLKTDQPVSPFHSQALLNAAARIARVPVGRLELAIKQPFHPALLPEFELTVAACKSAGTAELPEIVSEVDAVEASCEQIMIFHPNLPLFLLEEEVAQQVVDYLTTRYASDPRVAKHNLLDVIERYREAFLNPTNTKKPRYVVITLMSGLLQMVNRKLPFAGCLKDQVAEFMGSVVFDAILARNVTVAVLDDLLDPAARAWVDKHKYAQSISVFDSKLVIKRLDGTLACRLIRASDGLADRYVVEHYRSEMYEGLGLACHGLLAGEIAEFLAEFMATAGYRGFRRFWLK